ncbi:substrate-binding periplasmic protein [Vibrio marisflavi]|uniref:Solute-binding protein family 3/N-terminal domain-containing protein n=1 Tax=Vibrio marisflavi CECT 7928 TaxID=634439 RepID=A0ABN8DZH9_9VIBR|nr:transporter substrate-binding domain-containing protein [Vibrio marisflavi]CAH0535891.1 hypothetical protein VMF7928_00037 [Vibrio marisflavi CECT 7928]
MRALFSTLFFISFFCFADDSLSVKAVTDDYPPFVYQEGGEPLGVAVEVLETMASNAGVELEIAFYPWKRAYLMAKTKPDVLVFTLSRTPERENDFTWIGPIFKTPVNIYKLKSRRDLVINNIKDIKAHRVGAVKGYASEKELKKLGFVADVNLDTTNSEKQNVGKFISGRVAFISSSPAVLSFYLKEHGRSWTEVEAVYTLELVFDEYIGLNKNSNPALKRKLDSSFKELRDSGRIDYILEKHIGGL